MIRPTGLILDFGGVLTTDLWESVRNCTRREGLPEDALLNLLRHDARIHPMFVGLERGEVAQHDFEVSLAASAGVPADGLLARMCADLRPDELMRYSAAACRRCADRRAVQLMGVWLLRPVRWLRPGQSGGRGGYL